ncbi:uncharacterized protein TRIADDRAFT_60834 [Trichoplax adhaerens]|uniref:Uncharacterized protein n=1 Tax=Trichoplax adhaerens TaxID=10228 RepID=B3S9A5_TRIAD|nr:hypothetical protein TRIADDRAFT_60834 [Trichoplax adhaerens]EDV20612.1 hypothetical protein TRIADDRAFT_60834 [Trichoplax adhaerens]|eukprot:XP_002116812.1 hypothetical protein TRIADDRAFT_60834 [Trichoplax adhaerens]
MEDDNQPSNVQDLWDSDLENLIRANSTRSSNQEHLIRDLYQQLYSADIDDPISSFPMNSPAMSETNLSTSTSLQSSTANSSSSNDEEIPRKLSKQTMGDNTHDSRVDNQKVEKGTSRYDETGHVDGVESTVDEQNQSNTLPESQPNQAEKSDNEESMESSPPITRTRREFITDQGHQSSGFNQIRNTNAPSNRENDPLIRHLHQCKTHIAFEPLRNPIPNPSLTFRRKLLAPGSILNGGPGRGRCNNQQGLPIPRFLQNALRNTNPRVASILTADHSLMHPMLPRMPMPIAANNAGFEELPDISLLDTNTNSNVVGTRNQNHSPSSDRQPQEHNTTADASNTNVDNSNPPLTATSQPQYSAADANSVFTDAEGDNTSLTSSEANQSTDISAPAETSLSPS